MQICSQVILSGFGEVLEGLPQSLHLFRCMRHIRRHILQALHTTQVMIAHSSPCVPATGSLHLWEDSAYSASAMASANAARRAWQPRPALGGHVRRVAGLSWGHGGLQRALITVSADQTARMFASVGGGSGKWCEIARPQVGVLWRVRT